MMGRMDCLSDLRSNVAEASWNILRMGGGTFDAISASRIILVPLEMLYFRRARKWSERRPRMPGADSLLAVLMAECIFEREKEGVGRWDVLTSSVGLSE